MTNTLTKKELRERLATGTVDGITAALCSEKPLWSWTHPNGSGGELRGLAVRGGAEGIAFPADNPWGIGTEATVEQAVGQVWADAPDFAAPFVERLRERVYALALVSLPGGDHLAYLYPTRMFGDSDWRAPLAELLADPRVLWGTAPKTVTESELLGEIPEPLRALAGFHPRLWFSSLDAFLDCEGADHYEPWEGQAEEIGTNRLVVFAGFQDGLAIIDRDAETDGTVVVEHDPNDGLRRPRTPLAQWLEVELPSYLTGD